jgi:hypothetical protein
MSSLVVSNVSDGTLSIPTTYVTNGSAKAFGGANMTGTAALRGDSLNISSLTDGGTGQARFNLSNAMADAEYIVLAATAGYAYGQYPLSASQFQAAAVNAGGTFTDSVWQQGAAFGELA